LPLMRKGRSQVMALWYEEKPHENEFYPCRDVGRTRVLRKVVGEKFVPRDMIR